MNYISAFLPISSFHRPAVIVYVLPSIAKCCSDLTFHILNNQTISCLLTHLLFSDLYSTVGVSSPYGYFHIYSITAKM